MRQLINKETNARHERCCNIDCFLYVDHTIILPAQLQINDVILPVAYALLVLLTRYCSRPSLYYCMRVRTARRINSAAHEIATLHS